MEEGVFIPRLHALILLKLILALGFIPSAAAAFFQGVDCKNVFKKGRGGKEKKSKGFC